MVKRTRGRYGCLGVNKEVWTERCGREGVDRSVERKLWTDMCGQVCVEVRNQPLSK